MTTLYKILNILKQHISPEIDAKCLDFFVYRHSNLDDILAIELETIYSDGCAQGYPQFLEAKWMEVLINVHVSCPFENFDSIDIVFNVWEESLKKSKKYTIRYIVSALKEHHEDELWLFENERNVKLTELIHASLDSRDNTLLGGLLELCIQTNNFDVDIWSKLVSYESRFLKHFFAFTLVDYYVNYIFSDNDIDGMLNLCRTHETLKDPISSVLSKMYTMKAIVALEKIDIDFSKGLDSWENRASNILLTGLKHEFYDAIVAKAYDYLKSSNPREFDSLLIATYDYHRGTINEQQFCDSLPMATGTYSRPCVSIIIEILKKIQSSVKKSSKSKIETAIKRYEKERKKLL